MHELNLSEVKEQINRYFSYQPTTALAPSTIKSYEQVLWGKLYPFCQIKGISKLDESFVEYMDAYVAYLEAQGCQGQTIQGYLTVTKLVFTFLDYKLEYSYRIPRKDKQARDLKRERRWFSRREIALCKTYVFKKDHDRNHALVRIMCETGARLNEIATVRYEDIDTRGNKLLLGESKTVPRTVKVSPETSIYLERFLHKKYEQGKVVPEAMVFPGKNRIYKLIIQMLKDLGIKREKDGRGPHTFRHWLATHLYFEQNADVSDIAYLLGDQRDTIQDHYLHPSPEMMANRLKRASGY